MVNVHQLNNYSSIASHDINVDISTQLILIVTHRKISCVEFVGLLKLLLCQCHKTNTLKRDIHSPLL